MSVVVGWQTCSWTACEAWSADEYGQSDVGDGELLPRLPTVTLKSMVRVETVTDEPPDGGQRDDDDEQRRQ